MLLLWSKRWARFTGDVAGSGVAQKYSPAKKRKCALVSLSLFHLEHVTPEKVLLSSAIPLSPLLEHSEAALMRPPSFHSRQKPNKALEPTRPAVTVRAPSSTSRASRSCGSPMTLGKKNRYAK